MKKETSYNEANTNININTHIIANMFTTTNATMHVNTNAIMNVNAHITVCKVEPVGRW